MAYYRNVQETIGNTPLVELTRFPLPRGVRLFAKLEFMNPGGSVKDRLGKRLLEDAFEKGLLRAGGTLIEPTAGNTGIGLALAAIGKGIRVIFVVPDKFSVEKQQLMRALGAEVVNTPASEGMLGAIRKAEQLTKEIPGAYSPAQFSNPANPATYYDTLAPEIWRDMGGKLDVFVAGAGSGGTFMGAAAFLKQKNPAIRTVVVEPQGSILAGGTAGSHKTEGIGVEKLAPFMNVAYFDGIHTIGDEEAFAQTKELALREGLLVGSSSGAAMQAALNEAHAAVPGSHIVTVFPDGSDRYLSKKIYEGGI
ncbi:PLP-dependent cysteine synthase family protein [Paenibacillus sp. NPDC058071]|uniref:PLP-dependent cysteine synthase family protein n=1 Tax=Paenibacillus sp. NPDC058071 TaxID=3346326 RepID=UPI0036DBA3C6